MPEVCVARRFQLPSSSTAATSWWRPDVFAVFLEAWPQFRRFYRRNVAYLLNQRGAPPHKTSSASRSVSCTLTSLMMLLVWNRPRTSDRPNRRGTNSVKGVHFRRRS